MRSVPANLQSSVRDGVAKVRAYFSETYDIEVPDFSVYIAEGIEHGQPFYLEVRGGFDWNTIPYSRALAHQGSDGEQLILVTGGHLEEDRFGEVFAHEYFHLLQVHLQDRTAPRWGTGPWWLMEGSAYYADDVYDPSRSVNTPGERRERLRSALFAGVEALPEVEDDGRAMHHDLAAIATERLMEQSGGGRSYVDFWQGLSDSRSWQVSFTDAFGLSVDEFYEDFAEYYDSLTGRIHVAFSGAVEKLPGRPYVSLTHERNVFGVGIMDGVANLRVLDGTYQVRVSTSLQQGDIQFSRVLGFYRPETDALDACEFVTAGVGVAAGRTTQITIELPHYYAVEGVVFDSAGDPVPWYGGVVAHVHGLSRKYCVSSPYEAGKLYFLVPDGSSFTVAVHQDNEFVGWYGSNGLTTESESATTFTVDGADFTLPDMSLPTPITAEDPGDAPMEDDDVE